MKRLLMSAFGVALTGAAFLAPNALAEPSDACQTTPIADASGDPSTGGSASVCIPDTGAVTASGSTGGGAVVADGDSGNANPLDGYIGVEVSSDPGAVGACEGDYVPGANRIDPTAAPGDTSGCEPAAP